MQQTGSSRTELAVEQTAALEQSPGITVRERGKAFRITEIIIASDADGAAIRRCAIQNNVTMFTSLDTLRVVLDVLEEQDMGVATIDA